jgi:LysR family tcuABC transcriptional regulator
VVAEIDSLELVMRYVAEGGGATIQPMAATRTVATPEGWRCLYVSDAHLNRLHYLYALPIQQLSASGSVVRAELKQLVQELVHSGAWQGVRLTPAAPKFAEPNT